MRFALLEAKIVLIEIVSKFRIVLAPETKVSLQCRQDYLLFRYSRVHSIMFYVQQLYIGQSINQSINQTDISPDWGLSVQQELCL